MQERYQELLKNPDATVFKLVNLQCTLPVIFRHVPTVPEAHYRQIHVLPAMTVRQVLDSVTKEMGLKTLDKQSAPADYVFSQLKINGEDIEGKSFEFLSEAGSVSMITSAPLLFGGTKAKGITRRRFNSNR